MPAWMPARSSGSSCSATAAKGAGGPSSRRGAASHLRGQTCYSPRATSSHMTDAPLLLVVDDDPSVLLLVDVLAEKMGFRVKAVSSGLQALEQLRDGLRPAVILLEIMMVRIDGFTFMTQHRIVSALH